MTYILGYEYTYLRTPIDQEAVLPKSESELSYHPTWEDFARWKRTQANVKKLEYVGRKAIEYAHACDERGDVLDLLTKKASAR